MTGTPGRPHPLAQVAAYAQVAWGVVIAVAALQRGFSHPPAPVPLTFSLVVAGALELVLGIGLLRKRREAWSFSIALNALFCLVFLLAAPGLARSTSPILAAVPLLSLIHI